MKENLENSNFGMELEFVNELKDLESESVGIKKKFLIDKYIYIDCI